MLSVAPTRANEEVARQLQILVGSEVMQIMRVRLADDVPVSLDETYLPMDLGQRVASENLEVYPIFSLLEGKYATPLLEADYRLEAVKAEPLVASALGIEPGDAVMRIERVSYSLNNRPVDFEKLYYRGDKICLTTRLRRRQSTVPFDKLPHIASSHTRTDP